MLKRAMRDEDDGCHCVLTGAAAIFRAPCDTYVYVPFRRRKARPWTLNSAKLSLVAQSFKERNAHTVNFVS